MGTKRDLAPQIAREIAHARNGPLLDLFAGMAAVGRAVGTRRNLWLNDAQLFACKVNEVTFRSAGSARITKKAIAAVERNSLSNFQHLNKLLNHLMIDERSILERPDLPGVESLVERLLQHCEAAGPLEQARVRCGATLPYRLFSFCFAGGYFSLAQCAELDSIRYGIDASSAGGEISIDVANRMLAGLCRAATACASTTGHFAQYLTPKAPNLDRYVRTRRRSIWATWIRCMSEISPIGSPNWRKRNRVYNEDACDLLEALQRERVQPSVVYADPPYTSDQYSRYYHLLETLLLYDYPAWSGKGRYRPDRFVSSFCIKRQVKLAFETLASLAASMNATLVLSYPKNGLLDSAGGSVLEILKGNFAYVREPLAIDHRHSSLGASKGIEKLDVIERIFIAE